MTDPLDLPVKRSCTVVTNQKNIKYDYTEKQMDLIVGARVKAAEDVGQIGKEIVEIAKDIVAIAKIREQSAADVALIEAQTNNVVESIRAEISRLSKVGDNVRTRGEVAVNIIKELTSAMKEMPDGERSQVVDQIYKIVELALRTE